MGELEGLGQNRNSKRCSYMFSDSSGSCCESADGDEEMCKRRVLRRGVEALLFFPFFFFKGCTVEPELLCLLIQSKDWRK